MTTQQGILFDFNGTLFFDTAFHETAWRQYAWKLCGREVSDEEFRAYEHGRTNREILAHFVGEEALTPEAVERHGEAKEAIYRELCLWHPEEFCLAPGAADYLDACRQKGVPIAIATSSGRSNVDFYIGHLGLLRWFDEHTIVYNDGTIASKPAPDIYLRAAERLGLPTAACTVFEDMPLGIAAARNAGAGRIVAVASAMSPDALRALEGVDAVISDYRELLSFL